MDMCQEFNFFCAIWLQFEESGWNLGNFMSFRYETTESVWWKPESHKKFRFEQVIIIVHNASPSKLSLNVLKHLTSINTFVQLVACCFLS